MKIFISKSLCVALLEFSDCSRRGFTYYLDMDLFGYEDLLLELAHNGVKIQLNEVQKILFRICRNYADFQYNGEPEIKVYARFKPLVAFEKSEYETWVLIFLLKSFFDLLTINIQTKPNIFRLFDTYKIVHIKLIPHEHEIRLLERQKGLILVSTSTVSVNFTSTFSKK